MLYNKTILITGGTGSFGKKAIALSTDKAANPIKLYGTI